MRHTLFLLILSIPSLVIGQLTWPTPKPRNPLPTQTLKLHQAQEKSQVGSDGSQPSPLIPGSSPESPITSSMPSSYFPHQTQTLPLEGARTRLLIFGADWCTYCKPALDDALYLTQWKFGDGNSPGFQSRWTVCTSPEKTPVSHITYVDVDKYPEMMQIYKVNSLPTIIQLRRKSHTEPFRETRRQVSYTSQPLAKSLTDWFTD